MGAVSVGSDSAPLVLFGREVCRVVILSLFARFRCAGCGSCFGVVYKRASLSARFLPGLSRDVSPKSEKFSRGVRKSKPPINATATNTHITGSF